MPKRILRNALLMAAVTFLMALGLLFYIRSTGPLPGGGGSPPPFSFRCAEKKSAVDGGKEKGAFLIL